MKPAPVCRTFAVIVLTACLAGCGQTSVEESPAPGSTVKDVEPLVMPSRETDTAEVASQESLLTTDKAATVDGGAEAPKTMQLPSTMQMPGSSTRTKFSDDAFRNAALEGNLNTVQAALQSGTNVNSVGQDGRIALQLAAFNGHTNVVRFLIEHGAAVNHLDKTGRTALMYAATGPNTDTVKLLLQADAKIDVADNHEGFTALMFAAAEGQGDVVRALLSAEANTEMTDIDGDTAKSFAAKNGHTHVVELLEK